ncbi:MAG: alpha-ribazole phosphatase [Bacteroidales bacterium]|nr:alpha-ribazole phosphatase [Bacteroidales bacterium]
MLITALRHTKVNVPQGMCYGHSDVDVADSFMEEVQQIKGGLAEMEHSTIFCSPLQRCRKLADALFPKVDKRIDERLKELNFGKWEGMTWSEIEQTEEANNWFEDYINRPCPEGESFIDLIVRVQLFLDELAKKSLDNVLIITHFGVIRAMLSIVQNIKPKDTFDIQINYGQLVPIMPTIHPDAKQ